MTFLSKEKYFWNPKIGRFDVKYSIQLYSYPPDHSSYIQGVFCLIFAAIKKKRLVKKKTPAFFKILKEPILVEKKCIHEVSSYKER